MGKEKKNELTLKIFSLIIAIALWSYVMDEVNPIRTVEFRNVEVNLLNRTSLEREGIEILDDEDINIRVSISGRMSDIIKVSEDDIIAQVDLSGYSSGRVKVPVDVQVPSNVTLEDYSPKEVWFTFDRVESRDMPVAVETEGELPNGYVLGTPTIRPQSVLVEGPSTWLDSVAKVLATVKVTDITEDINVSVPIKLVDSHNKVVRGVSTDQKVVDISIPVYRVKTVPIELQTVNQLPEDYEIVDVKINPSKIDIVGREEALKNISKVDTVPIDIYKFMENKDMKVGLQLPEGVTLRNPDGEVKVTLNIDKVTTKAFDFTLRDVKLLNLDEDLAIKKEDLDLPFTVTVQGVISVLESLEPNDINVELDLAGLNKGKHVVTVTVNEDKFKVLSIVPGSLEITLIEE